MFNKIRCLSLLFMALIFLSGSANSSEKTLKIVTSFSILEDWVKAVGGEHVAVTSLVKQDEDVHMYYAKPKDMAALSKADLLVVNGLGLEGWMQRLIKSAGFKGEILVASKGVELIHTLDKHDHGHGDHHDHDGHDHPAEDDFVEDHATHSDEEHHAHHDHSAHDHEEHEAHKEHEGHEEHGDHHSDAEEGAIDPHAWTSLKEAQVYIKNINARLSSLMPDAHEYFDAKAQAYISELQKLQAETRGALQQVPVAQRVIVVPHNAFAYMARDFDLKVVSLSGISTESEASASRVANVVRAIRNNKVRAIFTENVVNTRLIEQVGQETDAKVYGQLISGALSKSVAPDYLSMMRRNLELITQALASEE